MHVSTDGQSLFVELKAANYSRVFQEKISGTASSWPDLLAELDKCDVLVVTRLDRLARSMRGPPPTAMSAKRQ